MSAIVQPQAPLRYFGSKWRLAEWICGMLPGHTTYVEVFGGSAAVLLSKRRSAVEVYNDIDGDVVRFFRTLRANPEEVARQVAMTPFSREEHALAFEPTDDDIEAARRLVVRSWQTRGGYRRTGTSSWWYQRGANRGNSPSDSWRRVPERLLVVAERFAGVEIERDDWREILRRFDDEGTCFYLDPPYLAQTRAARWEYTHEMSSPEQHAELLDAVAGLRGMVVLSGYDSEIYADALTDWCCRRKTSHTQTGQARTECLWLSPNACAAGVQREIWVDTL